MTDAGSTPSRYAAKPWLALLSDAQRAPITPAPTVLHAFRDAVARAPKTTRPSPTSTGA